MNKETLKLIRRQIEAMTPKNGCGQEFGADVPAMGCVSFVCGTEKRVIGEMRRKMLCVPCTAQLNQHLLDLAAFDHAANKL